MPSDTHFQTLPHSFSCGADTLTRALVFFCDSLCDPSPLPPHSYSFILISPPLCRTYNASITLGHLLKEQTLAIQKYYAKAVEEKKADYDRANKEVAILCNHQRSVPKGHAGSMEKLDEKLKTLISECKGLKEDYKKAKLGEHKDAKGKVVAADKVKVKLDRSLERLKKLKLQR